MLKLNSTKEFFDEIRSMGFFKRLFSWGKIIELLTDAYSEMKDVEKFIRNSNVDVYEEKIKNLKEKNLDLKSERDKKEMELKHLNNDLKLKLQLLSKLDETKEQNDSTILNLKSEISGYKERISSLTAENKEISKKIAQFEKVKDEQQKKYDEMIVKLEKREDTLEKRRQEIEDNKVLEEQNKFEEMKKTWKNHENLVEKAIKQVCSNNVIDYFDKEKVPFKGKPDNTIKIADEYIIFDAKSPANDNLNNFPTYIKNQAESLKKYVAESNVKKDLFLVVPTNVIDKLQTTFFDMSDYRVYVITSDSLEPIILSLRKIEEYEFAEKLSPEDRESICRVIGHFAHHTKRRLQIDTFLADKAIELLKSCEYLPEEILEEVKNHEIKSIVNVPIDKRSKKSELKRLESDKNKLSKELEIQHINTKVDRDKIESIELYDKEE